VAITSASPSIASGLISGFGLASANTIARGAIRRTPSAEMAPGTDRPMKTSAASSSSSALPVRQSGFVSAANAAFASLRCSRPG